MKKGTVLVFLISVSLSGTAWAQLSTRCTSDDKLTAQQRQGRNAWARKCGYISTTKESILNMDGEYQVFANGCFQYPCSTSNCQYFAPVSESAPCVSGLVLLGTCSARRGSPVERYMLAADSCPSPTIELEPGLAPGASSCLPLPPTA